MRSSGSTGAADVVGPDSVATKRVQFLQGPARAVTAGWIGRSCEGDATEVPPPNLVLLSTTAESWTVLDGRKLDGQPAASTSLRRSLRRELSPLRLRISAWWTSRSTMAATAMGSLKISAQALKGLLELTIMLARS